MLRALYDWTLQKAAHRHAQGWLAAIAFVESSVFPIPPDVLLMPMAFANRERAWRYALICTIASVIGGIAGYLIGWLLYDTVGVAILDFYGYREKFEAFAGLYNQYGFWIVLIAGVTPLPYKVVTIASGATGLSFPLFMATSVFARALRFFVIAALVYWVGPPIRDFIEKRLGLAFTVFVVFLVGGFVAIKYMF
ncbi:MAG: DedA family protein [Rhodobiaceae bacterium]|nr:DedA family protein [Rhodobiaceae bacterium]